MSINRKRSNDKKFNFIKNKKAIASIIFVALVAVLGIAILFLNDEGEIVASSSDRNEAFAEFKSDDIEYTIKDKFSINILVESGESPVKFKLLKNEELVLDGKLKKKEKYEKEIVVEKEKPGEYVYKLEITPDFGEVITKELVITVSNEKPQDTEEEKNKNTDKDKEKDKEKEKDKNTDKDKEKDKVNSNQNSNKTEPSKSDENPKWKLRQEYDKGDIVEYAGKKYECILGHSSQNDWKPDSSPTLWKRK